MPAEENLPWTTTRCNRLLRPISSRITSLRKEHESLQRVASEARNAFASFAKRNSPSKANFAQPVNARKARGFEKARDPDWVPGAKPQTTVTKKTYGGRAKKVLAKAKVEVESNGAPNSRPGEIAFTPLVARSTRFFETPRTHGSPLRRQKRGPLISKVEQIKTMKKQLRPDIGKLMEGLLDAYAKLLQATHLKEQKRRTGARSLMETCLQKMPAYIELEEYFAELDKEEADDDEDRDISNEIYTHLEERFATRTGQGWQHFRQIVRSHGTSLLCDAFSDEIMGLDALHAVVDLCMRASAWNEAEKFLWTFTSSLTPLPGPATLQIDLFSSDTSVFMYLVQSFVERTGRHGVLYDLLEHMISQELLPLEWLATECMRSLWNPLVRVLADGDPRICGHALRFLETTMFAGMGLPDDSVFEDSEVDIVSKQIQPSTRKTLREALDTTFSSLLTVISGIALVSHSQTDNNGAGTGASMSWVLESIMLGLLRRKDVRSDLELLDTTTGNMQAFAQRALWTALATLLVHLDGAPSNPHLISLDINTLVRSFNWISHQYSSHDIDLSSILATFPHFVSSAARCTGRALQDDGFGQLQRLVDALLSFRGVRLPHKLWNFKRVALESCVEFAHTPEHLAYFRQVEASMKMQGRVVLTHSPAKNETPAAKSGGFRWEEGMGEWVACTPFTKQNDQRLSRNPVRPLELLPTPVSSESSSLNLVEEEDEPLVPPETKKMSWDHDTTIFSDDTTFPQSSPLKKVTTVSRKRRSTSPMVIIPCKRTRLTPPSSTSPFEIDETNEYIYFPDTPVSSNLKSDHESPTSDSVTSKPRRSIRKKRSTTTAMTNNSVKKSRLRTSLRNIARRSYTEAIIISSSPSASPSSASHASNPEARKENINPESDIDIDVDERDELGRTPAGAAKLRHFHQTRGGDGDVGKRKPAGRPKRETSGGVVAKSKGIRVRPRKLVVAISVGEGDESSGDELSFL